MTRGPGWQFLDMGRRVERGLHTLRLVERLLVPSQAELSTLLEAILEILDSSMTYRYRYLTSLQLAPVLDLLLIDETNPRSAGDQLQALAEHVSTLPHATDGAVAADRQIMFSALMALRLTDLEALGEVKAGFRRLELKQLTHHLRGLLRELSDAITHKYLTHTAASRRMIETTVLPTL